MSLNFKGLDYNKCLLFKVNAVLPIKFSRQGAKKSNER